MDESSSEDVRKFLVGCVQSDDTDMVQMLMEKVTSQDTIQASVNKLPVEAVIPTLKVIHSSLQKGQDRRYSYSKYHPDLTIIRTDLWRRLQVAQVPADCSLRLHLVSAGG